MPAMPDIAGPTPPPRPWWERPGLNAPDGRLQVAGHDLAPIAAALGTPCFVYDLDRVAENAERFATALRGAGVPSRLRFALKANPFPDVLAVLRGIAAPGRPGAVGIDACSPGEVTHALAHGWLPDEISFTGTNVSDRDLDVLLAAGPIRLNLDAVSQVERVGRRAPGRTIGLRVNPGAGAGYHAGLAYAGERPTKFGIWPDRIDDALAAARRHGLTVSSLHFHAGSGWLSDGLGMFETALVRAVEMTRRLLEAGCPIDELNVGGGLGVPARAEEQAVPLDAYAALLARHVGPLGITVACEPGDYLVKDCAVLLGEVVTVEERGGTTFVGLDLGWNVNSMYFIYRYAQEIVPVIAPDAARTRPVTVAGHINEAGDVFAADYPMAPVAEGDLVAILNAGGYEQAMSSTHCLRPTAAAVFLHREAARPGRRG
jgi:diaminopimelate decarboxylase